MTALARGIQRPVNDEGLAVLSRGGGVATAAQDLRMSAFQRETRVAIVIETHSGNEPIAIVTSGAVLRPRTFEGVSVWIPVAVAARASLLVEQKLGDTVGRAHERGPRRFVIELGMTGDAGQGPVSALERI